MKVDWQSWSKPSFQKLMSLSLWALMIFLLAQRAPSWVANYRVEGKVVAPFAVVDSSGSPAFFPRQSKKQIIIFWATWCKPCELELDRFDRAVKNKEIAAEDVVAISVGEEPKVVFDEAKIRNYAFAVYADESAASTQSLAVQGTPQVYHVDEEARIAYASMGLSPLSIFRAKGFLSP